MPRGHWQISLAYRRITADQWIVGRDVREDKAPFGQPLYLDIRSLDLAADYGLSDRTRLSLTFPFSEGSHSRYYADGVRHKVYAAGLGDINLIAARWMIDPRSQPKGNVELGIGVKSATGRNDVTDHYFLPNGTTTFTVDQSIQLGDGGWGIILQARAFRELFSRSYGYANGSYLVSPRNQTSVHQGQSGAYSAVRVSVPDVYSARFGLAYVAIPRQGVSLSLGGRVDGIPLRDVIGRSDGFRRPTVIGYMEPGVTIAHEGNMLAVSLARRVYADFRSGVVDRKLGNSGGGDLARNALFVSVSRRF